MVGRPQSLSELYVAKLSAPGLYGVDTWRFSLVGR